MPGGNLALGAAEQNTFNQEEGSFGSLPQTSQDKLVQLYNANKGMDPTVAHYALQNQDINPAHVQQAVNYLNMVGGMKNGYISQANTDQMGFWQSVRNVFDTIGRNLKSSYESSPSTPSQVFGEVEKLQTAFSQGAEQLAKGTWDTAARAASTVTELATGGEIGAQGIGDRSKNLRDSYTTFNNMGYDLEPQHLWGALSHMGSYYESMAARKGWDYTLAHAGPNIIAAMLGGGELGMASADDSIESAATTLTQLQAKVDKGVQLTEDEIAKYQFTKSVVEEAKNRLVAMDERAGITNLVNELNAKLAEDGTLTQQESVALKEATERKAVLDKSRLETPEELKLRDENRLNKMRLTRRLLNTAATNVTKYTVGVPIAGARALLDAGNSATTFSLYAATAAQAQADPLTRQLWEQTLNGPVDAYGRPTGSFGQTLASYFMSKNNAFFHAASGLTDLYANYIAADPFAFAGSLSATARSEFGFSGVLGRWYGGIGVRTGDDVFRVMNNSIQITNAFDYMAKHSASDINAMFPYMYNRDALMKLGEAKNINEVAQIHADIADGIGLTRNIMPTLTPWKIFKSTFRSEALDRLGLRGFVGELLTEHYDLIEELADTVKKQTGMDIVPRSLTEVAVDDAGLRAEGIELRRILGRSSASPIYRMERFLARQLTARPMFYDETIKAFTSKEFNPGDIRAIPAIQNLMRIANYPEMVVKTVGDALIHTPDPLDFVNLWTNVVSHMTTTEIRRAVPSMMSETLFAPMRDKVNEIIQTAVGLDGGGVESIYGNGVNASRSSALMDPENPEDIKHAGFLENHLGRLNFFDPRILKGIQRTMVDAIADTYKVGASISDTLFMMERETIRQLAIFRKASISDITDVVRRFYDKHLVEIASHEDNARTDTFNNTHAAIAQRMENLYADPTKNDVEKFLEAHDYIRENATRIINEMEAYTKRRFDEGTYMYPVSKDIRAAQGEYQAYNDYERALGVKLQENFLDEKSLREWLRNYAEVTLPGQKAAQQDLIDIMRRRIDDRIEQNKSFLNRWQRTVDFGNRALSNTFVPLALYSGGWSLRVAASEYMLNSFRLGPMELFESKLAASIAKHEVRGVPLQKAEKIAESAAEEKGPSAVANMVSWHEGIKDNSRMMRDYNEAHDEIVKQSENNKKRISQNKYNRERGDSERRRGAEQGIVDRLRQDISRRGETAGLNYDAVKVIQDFVTQIGPDLFKETRIGTISRARGEVAANYEFGNGIFNLFKPAVMEGGGIDRELLHEMWHHLSQWISKDQIQVFEKELTNARIKFLEDNPIDDYLKSSATLTKDERKNLEEQLAKYNETKNVNSLNWGKIWPAMGKSRDEGYRLASIDEWFAETMYDRTASKIESKNGVIEFAHSIIASIVDAFKKAFGVDSSRRMFKDFWDGRYAREAQKSYRTLEQRLDGTGLPTANMAAAEKLTAKDEADLIKSAAAKAMDVVQNVLVNEAPKFVRDMFAGITMGFERGLLAGMDEERMYRMLDDFVGAIMRHGGHLPGAVHEAANYVDPELFTTHAQNITHGINDKGEPFQADTIRTPKFVTASGENLATALHENFHRVYGSDLARASMQDLQKIMQDEGISQVTEAEFQALHKRLEELTLKRIEEMDPALRARFKQDTMEMADPGLRTGNGPHADWAWRVVENNLALVHGVSKGGYLLHDGFVDQVASGEIHSPAQIAQELSKMGSATPRDIKARGFLSRAQWKKASELDFIKKITNLGHEKVFGPIVNSLVREPIFLLEYHLAMESMRDKLASGILSTDEAEVMADYQALINMKKYVHNPLERTQFENNMRVAAPFYFAQNQAWRRAFRVMEQDPGAFERYLKACLAVTNYVSIHTQGGQIPSLSIPGSQWLMRQVGSLGSQLVSGFSPSEQALFNNLGFGLSMDTGSINTIVPTGSVAGRGMFGELARPSWGPLVTIPIDYAAKYFSNHPWYNKAAEAFLGPVASQSGIFSEILPSTAVRDLIGAVGAWTNVSNTSSIASIENQVINDAMDNLHRELRLQVENEYDWTGVTPAQKKLLIAMVVDREYSDVVKSEKWANIVAKSKYAALAMYVAKLAIGFGSPMALSVRAQFSQSAAFQKIANSIDPDTGQPYSFSKAVALWSQEHPDDLVDLVSKRTAANGTNFPETDQYIQMWNNHSADIIKYPTLFAYYITRNGKYNPQAYSLQVNAGLESEDTPSELRQAIQTAIGNDYYYNVLEPLYYKKYGTWLGANNPNNNISYQGYKELTQAAREFGINDNPTWWANSSFGVAKAAQEANAVSQLAQFINDPNAANVVGQQGLLNLRELYSAYNQVVTRVREDNNMGDGSSAYALENDWYNLCQKIATEPLWAPQAYLITSVLAKLPTK